MLLISVVIFCLAGAGMLAMAVKYITAVPPLDYHAEILKGEVPSQQTLMIFGALYKVMGGAFAALGAGVILIAVTGVWNDRFSSKLTLLVMVLIAGFFATAPARDVENRSSVRTPWRIAAALSATGVLGFVLSIL